jgi:hypothetical protein
MLSVETAGRQRFPARFYLYPLLYTASGDRG